MDEIRKRRAILGLRDIGMVEMKSTGHWGLTRGGREFLDHLDLLRELDDRPGAPGRVEQSGAVTPTDGSRQGDDVRARRGARGKGTR